MEETLVDELVKEILKRLPIHDPACLVRAALVCKRWCRLVAGPSFHRRFSELHRKPPLLSLLLDMGGDKDSCMSRFVPIGPFRAPGIVLGVWRSVDSRHGRVLLNRMPDKFGPFQNPLSVWNPVTNKVLELPKLPQCPKMKSWSAAVLCTAATGTCDHLNCHRARGPFRVVFAATDKFGIFFCVYSSVVGAWSEPTYFVDPHDHYYLESMPPALLGNALYFHFKISASILKYDLGGRGMSLIRRPPACSIFHGRVVLVNMENGGSLGFAYVYNSTLYLWSREVGPVREATWVQRIVIKLEMLRPADADVPSPYLIGNIDGTIFFTWLGDGGVFVANLKSGKVVEVTKLCTDRGIFAIVPYTSYCPPVLKIASEGDGGRTK